MPETGIYKFKSFARDKNRNDSEVLEETIKVDTTNPTNPKMVVEPLKWTNKFVSVTLLDAVDEDSGFQKYQYKINNSEDWVDYKEPVIISNEGLHQVYAKSLDNVFNESEIVSGEAKVDKTAPSQPKNITTLIRDYKRIKISWAASNDNVGVTGYDVYLDSTYIATVIDTEYTFENLKQNKSYEIKIIARDEAENSSQEGIYFESTPLSLISTSSNHSIMIKADGTVWTWGVNTYGQLGDGTTTNQTTAVQVKGLSDVIAVAAGENHSMVLKRDGTVWTWGLNTTGQLGTGNTTTSLVPVQVPELEGIIAIAARNNNSYALKRNGTVWSWGINNRGQLGDGTTVLKTKPVQVSGLTGVSALSAGREYAMALKSDGTLWGWGTNSYYQLGATGLGQQTRPIEITTIKNVSQVAAGDYHVVVLLTDGTVWEWGSNFAYSTATAAPYKLGGFNQITSIGVGLSSGFAVESDGSVWAWGRTNNYGQLGNGTTEVIQSSPKKLSGITGVRTIAGGEYSTLALKADNTVWSWGRNDKGQLGDGTLSNSLIPIMVSGLNESNSFNLAALPSYFTVEVDNGSKMDTGQVTVTLSVYGADGVHDSSYNAISKLNMTKYHTSNDNQVTIDPTIEDINFNGGIAYLPLTFDDEGSYILNFELQGFDKQQVITLNISTDRSEAVLDFVSLPSTSAINGEIFDAQPVLRVINGNGDPVSGARIVAEIAGDIIGTLLGNVHITSDSEGYITFEDLGVLLETTNGEIVINFRIEEDESYLTSPSIKDSS
ncbi:hypothetical protein GCM10008014_39150 [Paenibacillus silvae]|uniref:Fibronectin type-III domain-containing protein n=1 Tax=Paenibacillus silvae TaxID=1325358 RepID=A0ABQ1ZG32_9BACL|nr:hypothetical protein [Paenibacillus silvae]GGH62574.1 hypothetical protein GCM10008014_39150 [Paenibacillus silvae]